MTTSICIVTYHHNGNNGARWNPNGATTDKAAAVIGARVNLSHHGRCDNAAQNAVRMESDKVAHVESTKPTTKAGKVADNGTILKTTNGTLSAAMNNKMSLSGN